MLNTYTFRTTLVFNASEIHTKYIEAWQNMTNTWGGSEGSGDITCVSQLRWKVQSQWLSMVPAVSLDRLIREGTEEGLLWKQARFGSMWLKDNPHTRSESTSPGLTVFDITRCLVSSVLHALLLAPCKQSRRLAYVVTQYIPNTDCQHGTG